MFLVSLILVLVAQLLLEVFRIEEVPAFPFLRIRRRPVRNLRHP